MTNGADLMQVAMPGDAKARNRQSILRVIRSGKPLTAAEIHQSTGISRQTVMRALQYFCQKGVIRSAGFGASTSAGGKKPEMFCFAEEKKILCINLWPQNVSMAISDMLGTIDGMEEFEHQLSGEIGSDLQDARAMADAYLRKRNLTLEGMYGLVLTVPGTVDYDTKSLRYNSQAPGWGNDVNMEEKLRDVFGSHLTFYIDNAGKAAGRALLIEHPEYEATRLMTFFTTWGVSACLMERGHVLNGRDSLIGEIGHMIISDSDDVVCGCGKRGCLESMVSLRRVKKKLRETGESEAVCRSLTIPRLFAMSAQGNENAQKVAKNLAHCFAVALQNLSLAYNQEAVVFQGDFACADAVFDECLRAELSEFRYYPQDGLFSIAYDRRNLQLLAAQGSAGKLIEKYFDALIEE